METHRPSSDRWDLRRTGATLRATSHGYATQRQGCGEIGPRRALDAPSKGEVRKHQTSHSQAPSKRLSGDRAF